MDTDKNATGTVTDLNNMSVVERVKSPTPKFFKTLRIIGLALAAGVMTAVSQTAVDTNTKDSQ